MAKKHGNSFLVAAAAYGMTAGGGGGGGSDADTLQGFNGAHYLDRVNHTGTQTASTISNFAATVATLPAASAASATVAGNITGAPAALNYYGTNAAAVKGFFPLPVTGDITGKMILSGAINPPSLTAHTDNYSPAGLSTANVLFLSSTANFDLTGIAAQENGRVLFLVNNGGSSIKLKNNNANSLAANRFFLRADATIQGGNGGIIIYESSISRWHLVAIY